MSDIPERVKKIVVEHLGVDPEKVTDKASFAYLADVYVLEEHRGRGLSKRLVETILAHPELQGLRRFLLATKDAHGLYAQFGFRQVAAPDRMMEIRIPPPWLLDVPV